MGGSTGVNIAGAIRLARELGPGKTIVTILCDYGTRYQSKLYNPAFLREKGLPVPGMAGARDGDRSGARLNRPSSRDASACRRSARFPLGGSAPSETRTRVSSPGAVSAHRRNDEFRAVLDAGGPAGGDGLGLGIEADRRPGRAD